MNKKYTYKIDFFDKEFSPYKTKRLTATCETSMKDIKDSFKKFLKDNGFSTKGKIMSGKILNAKGEPIGEFEFSSVMFS